MPQLAIGFRDFGGSSLFAAEYIVASKLIGNVDFTLGMGFGTISNAAISNPFKKLSPRFAERRVDTRGDTQGGEINYATFLAGEKAGIFGGVEIFLPKLGGTRLKIEYDTTNYGPDGEGYLPVEQDSEFNYSFVYPVTKNFQLKLGYIRNNTLNFGFSLAGNYAGKDPYIAKRDKPKEIPNSEVFNFSNGLKDYLNNEIEPSSFIGKECFSGKKEKDDNNNSVEWAVNWTINSDGFLKSFCNTVPTPEGGTHEMGLKNGLLKALKSHSERIGNKRGSSINSEDLSKSMVCVISLFIPDPKFQGQTKDKLSNTSAQKFIENIIKDRFENWLSNSPQQAEKLLEDKYDWKPYKHKHHESRFTRFYEDYWLPNKFGYQKRRAHFSSLILTGQMKREDALKRIAKPECDDDFLEKEFNYVADKLDFSYKELREIFEAKNKNFNQYRNKKNIINLGAKVLRLIGKEKRLFR